MSERLKRILLIVGFIAAVVLIGFLLWLVFLRRPATPPTTSPTITPPTEEPSGDIGLPTAGEVTDRVTDILDEPQALPVSDVASGGITSTTSLTLTSVIDPARSADGQALNYYDPSDGRFYIVDKNGNVRSLLPQAFPNAEHIEWSGDAQNAIVEFPDGANILVDFNNGDVVTLPQHWEDFDFAPHNEQIAAKSVGIDPGNRWLIIANPDGSSAETIAALGNNQDKVRVDWSPNDQVVAFSDTGVVVSGFGRKQMLAIGKNQENFPGLIVEGFSFESKWSEKGTQILYSTHGPSSSYQPQLWLTDGEASTLGQNRRSIPLNTWADKCTFADDDVAYCAVPQNLPPGSGLQRELARFADDSVYRINTRTGTANVVAVPEVGVNMTNLVVSADGSTLFYQDSNAGTLEQIRLR